MQQTLYRRPLPTDLIAFSSAEGRVVFREALACGGLDGYFPLAEQFHTQADPAFCGLGSLVVALNALGIDPGRLWKGPWRWFAEELLDCCLPLERVQQRGINLDELACLARCNGANVSVHRAESADPSVLRDALQEASRGEAVLIAAYDRASLGQTGSGHYSPIGGYHRERELALILDVARFKYPPHWAPVETLWRAMLPVDSETGRSRGWLTLHCDPHESGLGFTLSGIGESWPVVTARLQDVLSALPAAQDVAQLASAALPLLPHLQLRKPAARVHAEALQRTLDELRTTQTFAKVTCVVESERGIPLTLLLLALDDQLSAQQRMLLVTELPNGSALGAEVSHVRAQLCALANYADRVPRS